MKIVYHPNFIKSFEKCFSSRWRYAIPRWFSETKYRFIYAYQRLTRGYDDPMVFEYCHEIVDLNIKVLKNLKETLHGHPMYGRIKDMKSWKEILDKMILGFEARKHLEYADQMKPTKKFYISEIFGKTRKYELDKKLEKKWEKQRDEGMKLYVQFFDCLWD